MIRSRDVRPYLEDIADSIARIRRYTDGLGMDEFLHNDVLQDAVIRRIEILGMLILNSCGQSSKTSSRRLIAR